MEDGLFRRLLNVVDLYDEVIHVSDADTCGNHKLLEAFSKILNFWMWHLAAHFVYIRCPDKENLWYNIWFLVNTSTIASISVFEVRFTK